MSFAIGFASWKVFLVGGCLWLLHGGVGVLSRLMESSLLKREVSRDFVECFYNKNECRVSQQSTSCVLPAYIIVY
jgi:hypothetical protein